MAQKRENKRKAPNRDRRKWNKSTLKLPPNHGWTGTEGCRVFVADRGAVRFDVPAGWHIEPTQTGSITLRDVPYPNDSCRIEMSVFHLPRGVDFSGLPLDGMLRDSVMLGQGDPTAKSEMTWKAKMHSETRDAFVLVWAEGEYMDPEEHRLVRSRVLLARGEVARPVQTVITMDYWRDEAAKHEKVWDIVLKSLRVGEYIADPRDVRLH